MAKQDKKSNSQKELVLVMVLSLILGAGGGFALGAVTSSDDSDPKTTHSDMKKDDGHSHGGHEMFMVSAEQAPTVDLLIEEDAKSGYNIKVITSNFTFSPDNVNGDNVVGEGHAHLYVDDEKVGRLYSPYFHYDGSFEGTKTFRVTLNANDHGEYAVDGKVIETSVEVTHDSDAAGHDEKHMKDDSHSHDGDESHSHSDM